MGITEPIIFFAPFIVISKCFVLEEMSKMLEDESKNIEEMLKEEERVMQKQIEKETQKQIEMQKQERTQLEKQMKHKQKLNVISRKASLGDTILCIIMPYYFEKQIQARTWNLRLHVMNPIRDLTNRKICPFYSRYILGKE